MSAVTIDAQGIPRVEVVTPLGDADQLRRAVLQLQGQVRDQQRQIQQLQSQLQFANRRATAIVDAAQEAEQHR